MSLLARLDRPEFEVRAGEVVLLRGANGSGKTSLLRALAGLDSPWSSARGPLVDAPAPRVAREASYSPQHARDACVGLTVQGEARLRGRDLPAALASLASREVARLSSGEARGVAHALAGDAPLLLLDEPAEGLDEAARGRLRARVVRARVRGAVVAADHGDALADLATRIVDLTPPDETPLPEMPRADGAPLLRAEPVTLRGLALPGVSLGPGFHVVRGPNGSGKSTWLLHLARSAGARLALPHAQDALSHDSVAQELACAQPDVARALVADALLPRHPFALSGGEAQRVALAKALGAPATCYLLDEPEAHLDAAGRATLVSVIAQRVREGACVIAATHDARLAMLAQETIHL